MEKITADYTDFRLMCGRLRARVVIFWSAGMSAELYPHFYRLISLPPALLNMADPCGYRLAKGQFNTSLGKGLCPHA